MNRAKVLMVGPLFKQKYKGGISAAIEALLHSSLADRYNITYIPTTPIIGTTIKKFLFFIKAFLDFIFYLLINHPSIIHVHTASRVSFYRKGLFVIVAKIFDRKVILHIHGGEFHVFYTERGKLQAFIVSRVLDIVDNIIVLTREWDKRIRGMTSNVNISILHNPVDCASYGGIVSKIKTVGPSRVLFMGEIGKRKGVYDVISAASIICRNYRNVRFILAGAGEVKEVQELCKEKNLENYVSLPGFIYGMRKLDLFREADIFILPSYNEGLPVSVVEAMAAGLPIITTPVGGIPAAVEDGVNGFLVEPGNPEMLADRILRLLEDEELREKMGKESLRIAKEKFDVNIIAEALSKIYEKVLAEIMIKC